MRSKSRLLAYVVWTVDYLIRQNYVKSSFAIHAFDRLTVHKSDVEGEFDFDGLLLLAVITLHRTNFGRLFVHADLRKDSSSLV
jgi:hypothetical protein